MIENILTDNQRTLQAFRNVFDNALQLTIFNYSDRLPVIELVASLMSNRSIESMMSVEGISSITDEVFGDVNTREFYLTLQATFFSLMGEFHKAYRDLVESVAYGLSAGHFNENVEAETFLLTPKEYAERIYDYPTIVNYLLTNKWLLVYVLMRLWGRLPTTKEIRDALRSNGKTPLAQTPTAA